MAAAAGGAGAGAGAGRPNRVNIRTVVPQPSIKIGMNKNQSIYVQSLRGIGRDPRWEYDYLMKILPKRIDANSEMCVGLSKSYSKRSIENSNLIFAVEGDVHTIGIYGFASIKMYKIGAEEKKYFEIDVFCTKQSFKGIGKRIMDEIKKVASNPENSITSIVLKSTPGAIPFYLSQGFRLYDAVPDRAGLTRMFLNINGSDEESWKSVPGFSGDRIVPAEAAAAAPSPAPLPAPAPAQAQAQAKSPALPAAERPPPSAGGARRSRKKNRTFGKTIRKRK
jgi:hypothetical protein